ncbi:MAG TPA: DUF1289 domain-containing protein [Burkholderiaceae bacterium]|nr:DUF1289 domain-containing protein [Burkholderiaceae bacterium]
MTASAPPVPSPCVNVCRMDPATGSCEGCLRTLDEIARWSAMSEADKRAVWAELPVRRQQRDGRQCPSTVPRSVR